MAFNFSRVKTWSAGDTLTAADLNGEFDNIISNATPAAIGWAVGLKIGTFSIDLSTTGDQAITGVGFKPTIVEFLSGIDDTAKFGQSMTDGTLMYGIFDNRAGVAHTWFVSSSYLTYWSDGTNQATSIIKTLDADGFTITKAKANSPTGTLVVFYKAHR